MIKKLPDRKPLRLKKYDYSSSGSYFVTICTEDRERVLSRIISANDKKTVELTDCGRILNSQVQLLKSRYNAISIDAYVIMPDHVHLLISNSNNDILDRHTVSEIICTLKSITTILCRKTGYGKFEFQKSFHDHIIRNREDYENAKKYIMMNPLNWDTEQLYDDYFLTVNDEKMKWFNVNSEHF